MPVIGMIGMHGTGKSTALLRWKARYGGRLEVYPLDDMRRQYPGDPEKLALVEECRASPRVCVIESARGYSSWLASLRPTEPVIMTYCSEARAREFMEARSGKRLSAFWTAKRLGYESEGRYFNFSVKRLSPGQTSLFRVDDRATDWGPIDEHFGKLFRGLHNSTLRGGSCR